MKKFYTILVSLIIFTSCNTFANNISISNYSLTDRNITNHSIMVKFDISWENSWRTSSAPNNWDAAWVFVKYRVGSGVWQHAWLDNNGHINPTGSTIYTGLLNPALPFNQTTNPGLGTFIYRDANSSGTFSKIGVQIRWNYGANGVADNALIDIRIYAIEHVYIPQGSYYLGSGGTEWGAFYKYPTTTNPYQISSEGAITVGTATNNLYYPTGQGYSGDQTGPIPAAFPKGYNSFYCMKYEITQQGYVDFLNTLTQTQANTRKYNSTSNRYAISGATAGSYYTTNPYVACNFLSWADVAAYLDWSALRPMTDLEFEKSSRGPLYPVANEYAWGTSGIASSPYTLTYSGASSEYISTNYSTTLGNALYSSTISSINGPVRVGIFAGNVNNTNRVTSGSTYYGIMEMSGNVWEREVTVGNPEGRAFTGSNGNGLLDATGNANVLLWPGTNAAGSGLRGGIWGDVNTYLQLSNRRRASYSTGSDRLYDYGGRGVRLAP